MSYNKWYWDVMVQKSLQRILNICKQTDRNLELTANKEDFFELLKYLEKWEKKNSSTSTDSSIQRDLLIVRNFEGYETLMAA